MIRTGLALIGVGFLFAVAAFVLIIGAVVAWSLPLALFGVLALMLGRFFILFGVAAWCQK